MISTEPRITIGIMEHAQVVHGEFHGMYTSTGSARLHGAFSVYVKSGKIVLTDSNNGTVEGVNSLHCQAADGGTCTIRNVTIGVRFHWERNEDQTFNGNIIFRAYPDASITVINEIGVEQYLESVISSEMSAEAPEEFLKAHAITSRSWLVAMLERKKNKRKKGSDSIHSPREEKEIIRWYDREDHHDYDVCADDHCQRYQGITRIAPLSAAKAIADTRGQFLVSENKICDARFSKACGGRTELFEHAWEDTAVPYLQSISDSAEEFPVLRTEDEAVRWIVSAPDAYCGTTDGKILQLVLPSYDRETTDFFRWTVHYSRSQLEELLLQKSGIHFGTLLDIIPVLRGPSGRIYQLKIIGSGSTILVGKELEIRRWLSPTHLYSSAFIVEISRDRQGVPVEFTLRGAGWGHGVGFCQIGAAVMAVKGIQSSEILMHYFYGCTIRKLY